MERTIPTYTLEGVQNAEITTHYFSTEDKLGLSFLRFQKAPCDDVILLVHGLTTSTDMFIMPEHKNIVSYFLENGYSDVWSLDFRMSNRHPYNLERHHMNMDDIALYDYPAALQEIRKHIGNRRIHVICHCLGSMTFMMSLFGKAIDGITSVISNSVSLTPRVPSWSNLKLKFAPFLIDYILNVPYLSPKWGETPPWTVGRVSSWFVDRFHRECNSSSCHMLSLMWGTEGPALYEHDNLLDITHQRGGDLHGGTSVNYYRHVNKMVSVGNRAVRYEPSNPKYDSLPNDYLRSIKDIETPVLFMTGEYNRVFTDSNIYCHQELEKVVPGRHELHIFPKYGHQDPFMGKNSHIDIFPRLLEFVKKHSHE